MRAALAILALLALTACAPHAQGPNFLLIVLDDVGTDKVGVYGENPEAPPTPNLDALAADGIRFTRAYADPFCSPSRAGMLTGRLALRYGIGTYLTSNSGWWLPLKEKTLAEVLKGYDTAAVGKTHIGGPKDRAPEPSFDMDQGFGHYEGGPHNLQGGELPDGRLENYFHYERLDGDEWSISEDYDTVDVTNTAIREMHSLSEPWFLWVGYHAAHAPWHAPPDPLNPGGVTDDESNPVKYDAMVWSLDLEVQRLLDAMDDATRAHTLIVVMSDNGTPGKLKTGPQLGLPGKGTVYEGGMHVPLIIAGGPVTDPGEVSDALVMHTDLFATFLALTDVHAKIPDDSESFASILSDAHAPGPRDHVYAEVFLPRGPGPHTQRYDRAVRGERFKLIRVLGQPDAMYDLQEDPTEQHDLLKGDARLSPEAAAAKPQLEEWMNTYEGLGQ